MYGRTLNPDLFDDCVVQVSLREGSTSHQVNLSQLGSFVDGSLVNASDRRRLEFALGRYAASAACTEMGFTVKTIPILADRAPSWPTHVVGSITHTCGFASAAVARSSDYRSIGIDSEQMFSAVKLASVREIVALREEELAYDLVAMHLSEVQYYTLIFSAKESIYKAIYPIISKLFWFNHLEIHSINVERRSFAYRLRRNLTAEFDSNFAGAGRFEFIDDYVHTGVRISPILQPFSNPLHIA